MRHRLVGLFLVVAFAAAPRDSRADRRIRPDVPVRTRIAIVGAGLAGMVAALELHDWYHLESVVYEARDRVGGRTWSIPGPTAAVDLGGAFINSTDTVIRGVVRSLGLAEVKVPSRDDTKYIVRGKGDRPEVFDLDKLYPTYRATFLKIKADQERLGVRDWSLPRSLSPAARAFDAKSIANYLENIQAPGPMVDVLAGYFGANFGRKLSELDALHLLTGLAIDPAKSTVAFFDFEVADGAYAIQGGNQQIALAIERRLSNVHKNHVLTDIARGPNGDPGVLLRFDTPEGPRTVLAERVILAVPFSVLRESVRIHDHLVSEPVMASIRSEIQGRNSKMILRFSRPVWLQYHHSGSTEGPELMTWPNGEQRADRPGSLTVYFYSAQDYSHAPEIRDRVLAYLDRLFPGSSHAYLDHTIADWVRDPFTRGSFSRAKAPGQWATGWPTVAGTRSGPITFAGAHLGGDLKLVGYMNGAAATGQQAARLVAGSLGR